MKRIIIVCFVLLFNLPLYASLKSGNADTIVAGFNYWYHGGCYSDGRKMVFGDGIGKKLYIFNYVPKTNVSVESADVKILNCTSVYQVPVPNGCIIGNKLLMSDTDPILGWHIKIWNSVPTATTDKSSCDYKITGFYSSVDKIRTDGTKFCVYTWYPTIGGMVMIWNSVPEANVDTFSADAYTTDGYNVTSGWFGASGKFYVTHTQSANNTYYVSIFDPVPTAPFSMSSNSARITINSFWSLPHNVVELRNTLYIFTVNSDSKVHIYVWKDIPSSNTDTSNISNEYIGLTDFNSTYYNYLRVIADLHNFYVWNFAGSMNNVEIIANDCDTFIVTGSSLSPSTIDQRHLNQVMEGIRIYTYPGKTTLNSIKLKLTGSCADADITSVKVYLDGDNDGQYTGGTDSLLGSGVFSGKSVVIDNLNLTIDAGEKNILITYDVSADAGLNNTVGVNVEYLIFEKCMYEVPPAMSSSLSTIVTSIIPNWNAQLRINYTQSQPGSDTLYSISLDWDDATGGAPPLVYKITHSINDADTEVISESNSYRVINDLDSTKRHKYKVKVVDAFGNETPESNIVYDDVSPEWSGLFKMRDSSRLNAQNQWNYKIEVSWQPASDNTARMNFYEIWTKEGTKNWGLKASTWDNTCEVAGMTGLVFVKMRARDCAGNYAGFTPETKIYLNPFLTFSEQNIIGTKGGVMTLSEAEGEKVQLDIPEGAVDKEYSIIIEKIVDSEYTYQFHVFDANGIERKIIFKKPVSIKYFYNNEKLARIGYNEDNLHINYHDGVKWTNIGGELNTTDNTVKASVYRFSKYRMSAEKETGKTINLSSVFLTPNNDEINDALIFTPNWNYMGEIVVKIFDVNGKQLWEYRGNEKSIIWDCRTDKQNIAESGIYVYAIKVENTSFSGTIIISK